MGSHCSRSADSEEEYEEDEEEEETPAPIPATTSRLHNDEVSTSTRSVDSASLKRNFSVGGGHIKPEPHAAPVPSAAAAAGNNNSTQNHFMSPVPATEPRLNPLRADNDCSDERSDQSDFEAPVENPSSPGVAHGGPVATHSSSNPQVVHASTVVVAPPPQAAQLFVAAPVAAPAAAVRPAQQMDVFNEDFRQRIGKYLQNKFIRGLALVRVNEMITHPFACQHSVLVGALQDLKGERLRQSTFSLQLLSQKADVVLKFRYVSGSFSLCTTVHRLRRALRSRPSRRARILTQTSGCDFLRIRIKTERTTSAERLFEERRGIHRSMRCGACRCR